MSIFTSYIFTSNGDSDLNRNIKCSCNDEVKIDLWYINIREKFNTKQFVNEQRTILYTTIHIYWTL